jgi:hypothetical protein
MLRPFNPLFFSNLGIFFCRHFSSFNKQSYLCFSFWPGEIVSTSCHKYSEVWGLHYDFSFKFIFYFCLRGTLWHLQKLLQYITYIIVEFIPPSFSYIPPPPVPGIVSTGLIFHLHTWVHNICTIFTLLHPFPTSSHYHCYQPPPDRTSSTLLSSDFVKEKKMMSLFVEDSYTRSFLVAFPCIITQIGSFPLCFSFLL